MNEIGGLLDPVGGIWGMSFGLLILAWIPNEVCKANRKMLSVISCIGLVAAAVVTLYAGMRGVLSWTAFTSGLIHTVFFVLLGLLGFTIGLRWPLRRD